MTSNFIASPLYIDALQHASLQAWRVPAVQVDSIATFHQQAFYCVTTKRGFERLQTVSISQKG
jgi:hypothetical protein